jgi:alkaline phosphatase
MGKSRGFFLTVVDADIDISAHAGDEVRVNASVTALARILKETSDTLASTCVGAWRVVVVGSHATGGAFGAHRHHSAPGTAVPVLVAGRDVDGRNIAQTLRTRNRDTLVYAEISRIIAPRRSCGVVGVYEDPTNVPRRRLVVQRPNVMHSSSAVPNHVRYYGNTRSYYQGWDATVFIFFMFTISILFLLSCALPTDPKHSNVLEM